MTTEVDEPEPSRAYAPRGTVALLLALTLLSGIVDAVCVLALSRVFVANMTGNLVFVGLSLSGAPGFSVAATLYSLGGFVVGVEACHRYARSGRVSGLTLLRHVTAAEAVLLAGATMVCAATGGHPTGSALHVAVVVCAVALGGQNTVARRMGITELTTTVMTGTLIGLVGNLSQPSQRRAAALQSLSVAALVTGALLGAVIVRGIGPTTAVALTAAIAAAVSGWIGRTDKRIPAAP